MIVYCDSSALVKKYLEERQSKQVGTILVQASMIIISVVGYAEILAAFHRKLKAKEITPGNFSKVKTLFNHDWKSFAKVNVSPEVNKAVAGVLLKYPLRGCDAIHLASAVFIEKRLGSVAFLTYDEKQRKAAQSQGLETEFVAYN